MARIGIFCVHWGCFVKIIFFAVLFIGKVWIYWPNMLYTLWWRHNGRDSVSIHQRHDCLPNRLFRRRSKKTSKLRVTGLCAGNSPGTSEFLAQMASNAEKVFIWWRHHEFVTIGSGDGLVINSHECITRINVEASSLDYMYAKYSID